MRHSSTRCFKCILTGISLLLVMISGCSPGGSARQKCSIVLDNDTLSSLRLSLKPNIEMRPGETRTMSVGVVECCVYLEPVDACVAWSIEPEQGAAISSDGELAIDSSTPGGTVFTVTANVENGRRMVSTEVYVYDLAQSPLVGTWHEAAQIVCGSQEEVTPDLPIGELRFFADGRVNVTWVPFETYVDYSGTYTFSENGTLELVITGGSYTPDDIDGQGTFFIDQDGQLLLQDMWLGSPHEERGSANCGHRFVR
jgi:hypothetical protein